MNKEQYLSQFGDCLKDLTESERREALEFYSGYFEDGLENGKTEGQIIEELGSPQEAAEKILASAGTRREGNGFGTAGPYDDPGSCGNSGAGESGPCASTAPYGGAGAAAVPRPRDGSDHAWKIIGIVLACIFLGPPAVGVGLGLIGAACGILVALAAVVVVVPAALLWAAFVCIAAVGSIGVSAVGWCLLLLGLGALAAAVSCLIVWQLARLIRFLYRKAGESAHLHRRQKAAENGARR